MPTIRVLANAKINIGLYVTQKRSDGYHDLETVFFPIRGLYDTLDISLENSSASCFSLEVVGNQELASEANNILERAYALLSPYCPPKLQVRLTKRIPTGGGLGGGSADASFFLRTIAPLCKIAIPPLQLASLALELGSDCPFFLLNSPALGRGRGEILTPLTLPVNGYYLLIVVPKIHLSTQEAFAAITPHPARYALEEKVLAPIETWSRYISNDFQAFVTTHHPIIDTLLSSLRANGAIYTSLSGSGSAIFGLFRQCSDLPDLYNLPDFTHCLIHLEKV